VTLLFCDGFDGYGSDGTNFANRMRSSGWNQDGFNAMGPTASTRSNIGFAAVGGNNQLMSRAFNNTSSLVAGFAYMCPGGLSYREVVALRYDNFAGSVANVFNLYLNATGALTAALGSTVAYSPVNVMYPNTWHYVEVKITTAGTPAMEVRVDGNTVITATIPASSPMNLIRIGAGNGYSGTAFDDMYVLDADTHGLTDFLGDCVVHTMIPYTDAGPNATNQFGGGVTHASAVNGYPLDETTSYLYSNNSGDEELFTISELPTDIIDVLAVQVNVRAKKDSAGIAKYNIALKSGSTLALSDPITPTPSMLERNHIWESDPNGGAWTKANVQNVNIGFKVV